MISNANASQSNGFIISFSAHMILLSLSLCSFCHRLDVVSLFCCYKVCCAKILVSLSLFPNTHLHRLNEKEPEFFATGETSADERKKSNQLRINLLTHAKFIPRAVLSSAGFCVNIRHRFISNWILFKTISRDCLHKHKIETNVISSDRIKVRAEQKPRIVDAGDLLS